MSPAATAQVIEHEIGPTGELVLKLVEGEVRIHATDGPLARVVVDAPGLEDRIGVERSVGLLQVRVPEQFMSFGWLGFDLRGLVTPHRSVELDVEVPRMATVVVDGASTRVRADGLVGEQRIHVVSGDVRLDGGGGRIRVDGVSGRVAVDAVAPVAIAVRTVSGDVSVSAPSISELRISSMSASVDAAAAFAGDGPFRIESVSGRCAIATNSPLRVESHTMTGSVSSERPDGSRVFEDGRTFSFGQGGPTLSFNSMSGSLRLRSLGARSDGTTGPAPAATGAGSTSAAQGSEPAAEPAPGPAAQSPANAGAEPAFESPAAGPTPATGPAPVFGWDASQLAGQSRNAPGQAAPEPRDRRIAILRALERGEIDVDEASRELERLDGDR